ncbi:MAG: sodium/solute symporter [Candidatus Aminicenantes bacterium]|nr:sodium/solute symporter [Candidatus Aminicenantes bacterium]
MTSSQIIIIGALAFVAVLFAVGFYASRNIQTNSDFIVAGRRLPLWLCVFTVFATWFGSGTLIGAAGAAYGKGMLGVLSNPIGSALCLFLAGLFYVRILRRMRLLTLPDLFRRRYGRAAEILCSLCIIPAYIGWVGSIFVAFGYVMHTTLGLNTTVAILLSAAVVVVYTFAGGMWAVSLTDFLQALVIIVGLLILFPLVLKDLGGFSGLYSQAPAGHFSLLPAGTFKDWVWFIQALLVIGIGNIASQDLLQRAFSSRDERVAQWSMYITTFLYLSIAMIPVLLGIAGTILLPEISDPEYILPALGMKYLHPVAMAVFVGALFSALMSSADGGILAPASIFGQNILRILRPKISEKNILWSTRWAILVIGLLGLATALYFQNVYRLMVKSFSILFVGLVIPMTAAIYWKKANTPGAVASIISGMGSWLLLEAVQSTYPADLMAAGIGLVTMIAVTLLTQKQSPAKPITDIDGNILEYRERLGTLGFPRPGR